MMEGWERVMFRGVQRQEKKVTTEKEGEWQSEKETHTETEAYLSSAQSWVYKQTHTDKSPIPTTPSHIPSAQQCVPYTHYQLSLANQ